MYTKYVLRPILLVVIWCIIWCSFFFSVLFLNKRFCNRFFICQKKKRGYFHQKFFLKYNTCYLICVICVACVGYTAWSKKNTKFLIKHWITYGKIAWGYSVFFLIRCFILNFEPSKNKRCQQKKDASQLNYSKNFWKFRFCSKVRFDKFYTFKNGIICEWFNQQFTAQC